MIDDFEFNFKSNSEIKTINLVSTTVVVLVIAIAIGFIIPRFRVISYVSIPITFAGIAFIYSKFKVYQYSVSSKNQNVFFRQNNTVNQFSIQDIKYLEITRLNGMDDEFKEILYVLSRDDTKSQVMDCKDYTLIDRSELLATKLSTEIYYSGLVVETPLEEDKIPGKVRINDSIMRAIGGEVRGFIEIIGKENTVAMTWPAYPHDQEKNTIRLNKNICQNANVKQSDLVTIRKVEPVPAEKIIFYLKNPELEIIPSFVKFMSSKLVGYPITLGDTVNVLFSELDIQLVAQEVNPAGILKIRKDTTIEILSTPIEKS